MNIALFCPNWVGDVVMATPALRAIRRHFAHDRIIGVLRPYVAGVLDGAAWFDETIRFGGPTWADSVAGMAYKLRRIGIDLAVLFPNSFRVAMTAWLGGCRRIVGYARDGRTIFLTDRLDEPRDVAGRRIPTPLIDAYNRLAELVGCASPGRQMMLATTADDEAAADRIWTQFHLKYASCVVAFNPGAAYGSAKLWPAWRFAELARQLIERRHISVLVLCGPNERQLAREIVELTDRPGIHSLAEVPLSLGLTKACVRRADLLVTTDSGPRHFAAAFDRPVVSLFGPTHIAWTETYYSKATHLQIAVDCGPCQLRECPLDHRCMRDLTADLVYVAVVRLLEQHQPAAAGSLLRRTPACIDLHKRAS